MNEESITYGTYRRKSMESEDRQILSLEDQERDIEQIVQRDSLKVGKRYRGESKSAYKRGRPVFAEMMNDVEAGHINGIIVWHANRLARNAFDGGWLITAMDEGKLKQIKTTTRTYRNTADDKFFLQLEFGMAKKSSDDSSEAVKRGLKSKLEAGWMPGTAPLGYENTKLSTRGANTIVKDEERFSLLRKAWELMLTGTWSVERILDELNNEWGFRTRPWKRRGSMPLSRSALYKIFTNPFYYGMISYQLGGAKKKDKKDYVLRPGKHEPMVTLDEFDKVQILLGSHGKPRPTRHEYAYNGVIVCGECGGFVSATYKEKVLKSTGELQRYTLYYCVCARKHEGSCSQSFYTRVETIEGELEKRFATLDILPGFTDFALEVLADMDEAKVVSSALVNETRQKAVGAAKKQLDTLVNLRLQDLIDDVDFARKQAELKNEISRFEVQAAETEESTSKWKELTASAFEFATYAHLAFKKGDARTRREILEAFGLNRRLYDGGFSVEAVEWLVPIEKASPIIREAFSAFEPEPTRMYGTESAFEHIRPLVRGRRDLNPQPPACTLPPTFVGAWTISSP